MNRQPMPRRGLITLMAAALAAGGGLIALGFGIAALAHGDSGDAAMLLTALIPGLLLPLAIGAGLLGAAWRGWLIAPPPDGVPDPALPQSIPAPPRALGKESARSRHG